MENLEGPETDFQRGVERAKLRTLYALRKARIDGKQLPVSLSLAICQHLATPATLEEERAIDSLLRLVAERREGLETLAPPRRVSLEALS